MRKLLKIVAVIALAVTPILVGVPASAQQATGQGTCEIGFTGPDSQNLCTSTTEYRCEVTNTNTINITSTNQQDGVTGGAFVSGNTNGGSSVSGTVTNENGTVFNVTVTNTNPDNENGLGTCVATRTVPATIPPAPVEPTGGEGEVIVLPVTSGESILVTVGTIAAGAIVLALTSIGAVYVYRRFKV